MVIANLEKLLTKDKIKLGKKLLSQIKPKKTKPQMFWVLSRIGARELLYGSADRVIQPEEIKKWIDSFLSQNWKDVKSVGSLLINLSRKTGDITRDLEPDLISNVIDWLSNHDMFKKDIKSLTEVVALKENEESTVFGDALTSGIILK